MKLPKIRQLQMTLYKSFGWYFPHGTGKATEASQSWLLAAVVNPRPSWRVGFDRIISFFHLFKVGMRDACY